MVNFWIFDLLIDFFDLIDFINLFVKIWSNSIKISQIYQKFKWFWLNFAIINSKSSLESESHCNCHLNLLESKFESSLLSFGTPNRINLVQGMSKHLVPRNFIRELKNHFTLDLLTLHLLKKGRRSQVCIILFFDDESQICY